MIRKLILCGGLSLAAAIGTAWGQQPAMSNGQAGMAAPSSAAASRYRLQRSDVFTVTFPLVPEYNQTLTVQPDGYVSLESVGEMYVMGETLSEVTDAIRAAYSKVMHEPIVAINLTTFVAPYYTALGEVTKPGQYALRQQVTVTEAIALAGGLTHEAKHSSVVLFHHTESGFTGTKMNIKHLLNSKNLTPDVYVQSGDLIWIPTSFLGKLRPYIPNYGVNAVGYTF